MDNKNFEEENLFLEFGIDVGQFIDINNIADSFIPFENRLFYNRWNKKMRLSFVENVIQVYCAEMESYVAGPLVETDNGYDNCWSLKAECEKEEAHFSSEDEVLPSTSSTGQASTPSASSVQSLPAMHLSEEHGETEESAAKVSEFKASKKGKFTINTVPKSSSRNKPPSDLKNDSHVGERTPHTCDKNETINNKITVPDSFNSISLRFETAYTPQPIRIRDMPLPALSWTDHADLSLLMCYKEEIGTLDRDPLIFRRNSGLNTRMRAILLDWLMEVCDVYKFRRVTYHLAVDYFDRFLSKSEPVAKNHLQLLGITCLFIATKVEEIYPPKLQELAYVTDGACTEDTMLEQEMSILKALRWDVNPMTVTSWLCLYLQLACSKDNNIRVTMRNVKKNDDIIYPQFSPYMFMTCSLLVDVCSLDDGMLQFKYSVIAASAIYYVLNREKALFVSGYTWDKIKHCVEWMEPFATIVFQHLNVCPIVVPVEYVRSSSGIRVNNSLSIVLDEGHTLQNHIVNLPMLESVYTLIQEMRNKYKQGLTREETGWTTTIGGYAPKDKVLESPIYKQRRRKHRERLIRRKSKYAFPLKDSVQDEDKIELESTTNESTSQNKESSSTGISFLSESEQQKPLEELDLCDYDLLKASEDSHDNEMLKIIENYEDEQKISDVNYQKDDLFHDAGCSYLEIIGQNSDKLDDKENKTGKRSRNEDEDEEFEQPTKRGCFKNEDDYQVLTAKNSNIYNELEDLHLS